MSTKIVLPPLKGTKTPPLSPLAAEELRRINNRPRPRQQINPGVVNRLLREVLVEVVLLPSPYAIHKGGLIDHLQITAQGKQKCTGL